MPRKKTLEELKAKADAAEKRAKKLKEELQTRTIAEEATLNVAIIRAIEKWRVSCDPSVPKEKLPQLFLQWASENSKKRSTNNATYTHGIDSFSNRFSTTSNDSLE